MSYLGESTDVVSLPGCARNETVITEYAQLGRVSRADMTFLIMVPRH